LEEIDSSRMFLNAENNFGVSVIPMGMIERKEKAKKSMKGKSIKRKLDR
jgi:hypothetical protein